MIMIAKIIHVQGTVYRRQNQNYQLFPSRDENIFSGVCGCFWKIEGAFALEILCVAPITSDIIALRSWWFKEVDCKANPKPWWGAIREWKSVACKVQRWEISADLMMWKKFRSLAIWSKGNSERDNFDIGNSVLWYR